MDSRYQFNHDFTYVEEKFNFILDTLADEFCELNDYGHYVIKPEYQSQF